MKKLRHFELEEHKIPNNSQSKIILVQFFGQKGSGKSYFSNKLASKLRTDYGIVSIVLSYAQILKQLICKYLGLSKINSELMLTKEETIDGLIKTVSIYYSKEL